MNISNTTLLLFLPSLLLFLPFISALKIVVFFRRRGNIAAFVSVFAALLISVLSFYLVYSLISQSELDLVKFPLHETITWFHLGDLQFNMGFLIDYHAITMLLVVSFVGFLIHLFSMGYMKYDANKARYFAGLSIFMFSMVGIVLADNLIMLFIFWELVGFSSYALIAHYNQTSEASNASKKAFIVNRIGDFGFLIGIIWSYWHFGTVNLMELAEVVGGNKALISSPIALLLICGFIGKSAQFPLQVWLPDAMAGPTPVSALIHAATMVAAGIYFLVRIFFLIPEDVLNLILWLGALMTAYAGFCALGQNDIKKILAYSTLSQLGYMATAIGLGYPGLAIFHLATHACFKALLFLSSGSIIDALHHEQDIFKMGGLLKRMPITAICFTIGFLALCGVTMTSGYFSKDAIIESAYLTSAPVYWLILFSAFLTSVYMGRLYWIVFFGKGNSKHAQEAKESSFVMVLPLIILAILSLIAGFIVLWPESWSASFIQEVHSIHEQMESNPGKMSVVILTTLAWILGLSITYFFYGKGSSEDTLEKKSPALYELFKSKLWIDETYDYYVKKIQQRFANILSFFDLVFISGLIVRGTAGIVGFFGLLTKALHVGNLHAYVYWFIGGILLLSTFIFRWV